MIYNLYNALKGQIAPLEGVEGVEWFKAQYEGENGKAGYVYIECLPQTTERDSKGSLQTNIQIRLHVVSAAEAAGADPAAPSADHVLELHDQLADRVLDAVEGMTLPLGEGSTRRLEFAGCSYQPKFPAWLATLVELRTRG